MPGSREYSTTMLRCRTTTSPVRAGPSALAIWLVAASELKTTSKIDSLLDRPVYVATTLVSDAFEVRGTSESWIANACWTAVRARTESMTGVSAQGLEHPLRTTAAEASAIRSCRQGLGVADPLGQCS